MAMIAACFVAFFAGVVYARSYSNPYVEVIYSWLRLHVVRRKQAREISEVMQFMGLQVEPSNAAMPAVLLSTVGSWLAGIRA